LKCAPWGTDGLNFSLPRMADVIQLGCTTCTENMSKMA